MDSEKYIYGSYIYIYITAWDDWFNINVKQQFMKGFLKKSTLINIQLKMFKLQM